jgi:hypothetical protein
MAGINVAWADISGAHAATDAYAFPVNTQTGTGPVAFTNSTAVTNGVGVFTSNNAAGMTVSTGGGGSLVMSDPIFDQAASASNVSGQFAWSGIIQNSTSGSVVEVPFTIGNNVLLLASINANAHPPGLSFLSMFLVELP